MKRKHVINWEEIGKWILNNCATIIAFLSLVVTIAIGGITIWIGGITNGLASTANELTERNQAIDIGTIDLIDDNEGHYLVHPQISQGKIKKAYVVLNTENGIIYDDLEPSIDDFKIDKQIIDVHEVKVLDMEAGVTDLQEFAEKTGAQINDIVDFGLVFQDYTNQWSLYYVLIRPGFVFSGVTREYKLTKTDGSTITYTYTGNYIAEQKLLVIDTALINENTLEKELDDFNDYNVTAYFDKKNAITEPQDDIDMTMIESKIELFIPYTFRDANNMINIINSVKDDLY